MVEYLLYYLTFVFIIIVLVCVNDTLNGINKRDDNDSQ
jgi:hypothetical protein